MTAEAPKVQLRIRRADLIDQIIHEAQEEHRQRLKKADADISAAAQEFVNAVSAEALKIAAPVIDALKKVSKSDRNWRADFKWSPEWTRRSPGSFEYEASFAQEIAVKLSNGERYSYSDHFTINLKLTPLLVALRTKALDAARARGQLAEVDTRIAAMRVDAGRKIIRQAIRNLPEGEKLLEAVRSLRIQAEQSMGKGLLLPES